MMISLSVFLAIVATELINGIVQDTIYANLVKNEEAKPLHGARLVILGA